MSARVSPVNRGGARTSRHASHDAKLRDGSSQPPSTRTSPRARPPWRAPTSSTTFPPHDWPATTGRSQPRASMTDATSSATVATSYGPSGVDERPWPRRSTVAARWPRSTRCAATPSHIRAFDASPWTRMNGAASPSSADAGRDARVSTASVTPGATRTSCVSTARSWRPSATCIAPRPLAGPAISPVAQEPLDVGDEVLARGLARLVDHRLQALDVRAGRLVGGGRGVQPLPELPALLLEVAAGQRDVEMPLQRAQQLERRERVRTADVMRDLGEVADGRDAGLGHRDLEHRQRGGRHAQEAGGPGQHASAEEAISRRGPEDGHGAGMRHGRRDRAEADPARHAEQPQQLDGVVREAVPAVVGLRAREDEEVPAAVPRGRERHLGPVERVQASVADRERGPARAVVEELVGVEPRDDGSPVGEQLEDAGGGRSGVDPAVERREDDGRLEIREGTVEAVERHATSLRADPALRYGWAGRPFTRRVGRGHAGAADPVAPPAAGTRGFTMIGRLVRVLASLFAALLVFVAGAAVYAKVAGRTSTTPEPDADEIDLVATFGPMEYHSTASSFRGGTVTTWFGGGTVDLRNAKLDPAGATIRTSTLFGGGNLIVPDDWRVETALVGIGGAGDGRPSGNPPAGAPTLRLEGLALFGGWGVTSEPPGEELLAV